MKLFSLICAILLFGIKAGAQDKSNDTTARYFLIQASIGNLQEIQIAKLAMKKSSNPEIKSFASQMIMDHKTAQAALVKLAGSNNIMLPKEALDSPVDDMMLKDLSPKEFDRMYVHMMVPDHRQTVQMFEKYSLTGKNPAVASFASQTLPTLKQHLAKIVAIDDAMTKGITAMQ